ncbi:acetyltransferase [Paenibacillus thalictri]|uniref:Acetyltransferase n=1 Tax=Paenibacillus thalictri TaxID=2527873 RepID=A0A4Q9DII8_9BACL|nr:acetyltransferase [Paenibacillus thalictri]TBL73009.1 acetyltransferase [Paenibacillus thalictri]
MNNAPVIIIGGGGHAKVLADCLRLQSCRIMGFTDWDETALIPGVKRLGDDSFLQQVEPSQVHLVNGIGSVRSLELRKNIFDRFKALGFHFINIIHPSVLIANDVDLAEGTQIMAGAIIQPGCQIGCNTIVNTKVSLDHDCRISAHVHISPGSTLCGGVIIDESVHIGAGSTLIQNIHIGAQSLIGAGSVVIKDVSPGQKVFGVPAKVKEATQ